MKVILALVLASSIGSWAIRSVGDGRAVIDNGLDRSITCYIYYFDGDFKKLHVKAHDQSRSFDSDGLEDVECF